VEKELDQIMASLPGEADMKMEMDELLASFPNDADMAKEMADLLAALPSEDESEKLLAERSAMTRRWVDSGFKVGGHLPAPKKEKFDRWVSGTMQAALSDPRVASSDAEKLTRLIAQNDRNLRAYQKWERSQKSRKRNSNL
jgi:hypothetical protein